MQRPRLFPSTAQGLCFAILGLGQASLSVAGCESDASESNGAQGFSDTSDSESSDERPFPQGQDDRDQGNSASDSASEAGSRPGFQGIWFALGNSLGAYGHKYSGGLATYTAKHRPIAIYDEETDRTYFTYGGWDPQTGDLAIYVAYYSHASNTLRRPVKVHTWEAWDDPHNNAAITIDGTGRVWVFISGRGHVKRGFKYVTEAPHDVSAFRQVSEEFSAYPQPWFIEGHGIFHMFTGYADWSTRELYFETSNEDGSEWSPRKKLAGFGGHYEVSAERDGSIYTAFNYHPDGPDSRTNLYFLESHDFGQTWFDSWGRRVRIPLREPENPALILDLESKGHLSYVKDLNFDADGNPIVLFLESEDFRPGPLETKRTLKVGHRVDGQWTFHTVAETDHNYDMGSLWVEGDTWRVIAPTGPGTHPYFSGGEVEQRVSTDSGRTWRHDRWLTEDSAFPHNYVRRPHNAHEGFDAFWADGDPSAPSSSHLWFSSREGDLWEFPYTIDANARMVRPLPAE